MTLSGIDTTANLTSHAADLHVRGVSFACRYLGGGSWKDATREEIVALVAHGVEPVLVFEGGASNALGGHAQGVADAHAALAQAAAVGWPGGRPIFFAVDFDPTGHEAAVVDYFRGVRTVLAKSQTGVYGGLHAVKAVLDAGLSAYAWQTYGWSGGVWDTRAQIRQYRNGQSVAGVTCDLDVALARDYGQHTKPPAPVVAAVKRIVAAVKRTPTVSLRAVQYAAQHDPHGRTASHRADVLVVERALQAERLLDKRYADGYFGPTALHAYAAWQGRLGYKGKAANGIPGAVTLARLGARHGFRVAP